MRTITGLEELKAAEGETLGTSDWHEITQKDVDAFADVTGDHQWIHVDVDRAKQTRFQGHDRPRLLHAEPAARTSTTRSSRWRASRSPSTTASTRCGSRPRCPVGSKVRSSPKIKEVTDVAGGSQIVFETTFEVEGGSKPVCVAESVVRVYTG